MTTSGLRLKAWSGALLVIVLCLIAWNAYWFLSLEPEHDEVEHWHAAWLMYRGEIPFHDFFEHHSPLLWIGLKIYYQIFGESYGIIIGSRAAMFLAFVLIVFIIHRIARHWTSYWGSWLSALGFPLFSLKYWQAHLYVRGDPYILLLLLLALLFSLPLVMKKPWEKREVLRLMLVFILLGLAAGISPRGGVPALTIYLSLFFLGWHGLSLSRRLIVFLLGGLIVMLPTLLLALQFGFETYLLWVYKFSATLLPVLSPLPPLWDIIHSAWPISLLAILGLYGSIRAPELRRSLSFRLVIILAISNLLGLWAIHSHWSQQFLMTIPFIGFFVGIGCDEATGMLKNLWAAWRWPLAGWLLLTAKTIILGRQWGSDGRHDWIVRAQWLLEHSDRSGTMAAGTAYYQPIFRQDAFYYWFAGRYASLNLPFLRRDFRPYTMEDLEKARPTIVHETFADAWRINPLELLRWLEANYDPAPYQGFWILKKKP